MKALLFFPKQYAMHESLEMGLVKHGFEAVKTLDPFQQINRFQERLYAKRAMFSFKWRISIINQLRRQVNEAYRNEIKAIEPDLIIIYNSQFMLPATLQELPAHTKGVGFLGDNPYYTQTDPFNINILPLADRVYAADSGHVALKQRIGISRAEFGMLGLVPTVYEQIEPTADERKAYSHDISFIGLTYPNSWGYKRLYYLSHFCGFDFRVYGSSRAWQMWLPYFPELMPHFSPIILFNNRDMIAVSKCAKLTPVEMNPGILNGVHLRVFESVLMGVLPLVEKTQDCSLFFPDPSLPLVENRRQARELAEHYLNHEEERVDLVARLKQYILRNYTTQVRIEAMLHDIGLA